MRLYMREYQNQPQVKAKRSAYYKRPEVRQRISDRRRSKPEVIAKRKAWLNRRAERADYRASDEFKAVLKERNHQRWLKRKSEGKTREYDRKRRLNVQHRLGQNMRRLIHQALTRQSTIRLAGKTFQLIGCSLPALKLHLESLFDDKMRWDNYGSYWHVDHRIPLALFDLSDPDQQRIAFHFENLRPLEARQNQSKSDKVGDVRARYIRTIIPFKAA